MICGQSIQVPCADLAFGRKCDELGDAARTNEAPYGLNRLRGEGHGAGLVRGFRLFPRAEPAAHLTGGEQAHGAGKFGVHRLPGQGAQAPNERGGLGRAGVGAVVGVVEVAGEDVLGGELQETGCYVLDLESQLTQVLGDR